MILNTTFSLKNNRFSKYILLWVLTFTPYLIYSQTAAKPSPPNYTDNRADEGYSYLHDQSTSPYQKAFGDALKYISLSKNSATYLTLGGEYRPRYEYESNQNYTDENQRAYLQRLDLHAKLNLGDHFRLFGELYHGYLSSGEAFPSSDALDVHQAFIEFNLPAGKKNTLDFRLGRQELNLGGSRMVGNRNGPNMRRSFDLGKVVYGIEQAPNPELWSAGAQFETKGLLGRSELYYLGFKSKAAGFSDVFGEEIRHSIGFRRFGNVDRKFTFNNEVIYQWGDLDGNTISAFNIEFDLSYRLNKMFWTPSIGIKLDWSSGDRETDDGKLQTFNPLFVNPGLYSLAAVNTPANLTSFHPNILLFPIKNLTVYMDYAIFFRTSKEDGLYAPPRFQSRRANNSTEKHIGDAVGINLGYKVNRNVKLELISSYYIPGRFIKESPPSNSIFYLATTLTLKI